MKQSKKKLLKDLRLQVNRYLDLWLESQRELAEVRSHLRVANQRINRLAEDRHNRICEERALNSIVSHIDRSGQTQ